jgi:phage terminase large subunit-like protein
LTNLPTSSSEPSSEPDFNDLQQQVLSWTLELERRERRNRLPSYQPYPKQVEFHTAGADHRERLLMAGNQVGKTLAGSMEWAMHLTGLYPDWWEGKRFEGAVRLWAASETRQTTRDTVQRHLLGDPQLEEDWGTGSIPGGLIRRFSRSSAVANAIESVTVKHVSGNVSTLVFKAYEQGRTSWQGETLHGVWFDEEPPIDVYMEGLTRTNAMGGIVIVTFTPLKGMTEVVRLYMSDEDLAAMQ